MMHGVGLVNSQKRNGRWFVLLSFIIVMTTCWGVTPGGVNSAWAQDEEAEAPAEDAGAGDDGAAGEQAADEETGDEETVLPQKNLLIWMAQASGIFGAVLLVLSIVMLTLIVMNALHIRRDTFLPPAFIEAFEELLGSKDYQAAYETAKGDESFVARVIAAGMAKLGRSYNEAVDSMQEVGEQEAMDLDHRLSYLALIGTIAPMLGLMGTVYGMIKSFRTIATSETSPKPSQLADGISTALFTTLEGLIVAIPAMIAYLVLRNRVARLTSEVGIVSEGLMSAFGASKKSSGGAAAATAPAAPQK